MQETPLKVWRRGVNLEADWCGGLGDASKRIGVIATISWETGLNFPQLEVKVLLRSSLIFSINQQNQIRQWLVNIFKISN